MTDVEKYRGNMMPMQSTHDLMILNLRIIIKLVTILMMTSFSLQNNTQCNDIRPLWEHNLVIFLSSHLITLWYCAHHKSTLMVSNQHNKTVWVFSSTHQSEWPGWVKASVKVCAFCLQQAFKESVNESLRTIENNCIMETSDSLVQKYITNFLI